MASMGTLTIEMAANITRLQKDMDDAKASVGGAMESIQGAIDKRALARGKEEIIVEPKEGVALPGG